MAQNKSAIVSLLEVDAPLAQTANYRFDENDRQYIDNQIRGVEQHLVDALIKGRLATYVRVASTSASLVAGDVVCLATSQIELQITKATSSALASAKAAFGVVVYPAAPGAMALIATGGALPTTITGLPAGAGTSGVVRVNTSTARCESVTSLSSGDYGIGFVAESGFMSVVPGGVGVAAGTFTAGGDLTGTNTSQTVSKVRGASVGTSGGSLTTGNVLKATSPTTIDYGPVNLGGGANHVTGTLPGASVQTASGSNAGAMSSSDKTKLDGIQKQGASVPMGSGALPNDVDWSSGSTFTKTLSAGSNTLTFSNASDGQCIIVILTGASSTVTWPTVKWAGGAAPTQTSSGTDVYTFVKAGTTIYGSVVQAMA